MLIKTNKGSVNVPGWAILLGILVADNMYANHCRAKLLKEMTK